MEKTILLKRTVDFKKKPMVFAYFFIGEEFLPIFMGKYNHSIKYELGFLLAKAGMGRL